MTSPVKIPAALGRVLAAVTAAALALGGCAAPQEGLYRFEASFLDLFDTVTTVVGYAPSQEAFDAQVDALHDQLAEYHQLYDIYHDYDGINNLKTVNDSAGGDPVPVDGRILDLLEFCRDLYDQTGGKVNAAMGSVLSLWHDSREAGLLDPENAALPDPDALEQARDHLSFDGVIIDREASTVRLSDPLQRLDVGAVAKGYALEQVCREMDASLIVSLGGNVRITGPRPDGADWVVGIQDPDGGEDFLHTLNVREGSVVTSGDYQRYYTVDGVRYHHILDPDTGYPANRYRAVTVLCLDSGLADGLSTALFTMDQEAGQALLDRWDAQAMWVLADGTVLYSPGFREAIRS